MKVLATFLIVGHKPVKELEMIIYINILGMLTINEADVAVAKAVAARAVGVFGAGAGHSSLLVTAGG